jgi:hypothetical protein
MHAISSCPPALDDGLCAAHGARGIGKFAEWSADLRADTLRQNANQSQTDERPPMCLQTVITIASLGMKIAEGAQANAAAKSEAAYAHAQGRLARNTAVANAQRPLEEGRERLGKHLARAAQSNVDPSQGSPVDVAAKIAERAERDHLTTLHGGEVQAWHQNIAAANARARGRAALNGALFGAGMSLLGQAANENWFAPRAPARRLSGGFTVPYGG